LREKSMNVVEWEGIHFPDISCAGLDDEKLKRVLCENCHDHKQRSEGRRGNGDLYT
jgi:hypothetical protein